MCFTALENSPVPTFFCRTFLNSYDLLQVQSLIMATVGKEKSRKGMF